MDVKELSREQLWELKEDLLFNFDEEELKERFCDITDEEIKEIQNACNLDDIKDETIYKLFDGIDFVNDDFFCSMGKSNNEIIDELIKDFKIYANDHFEDNICNRMYKYDYLWFVDFIIESINENKVKILKKGVDELLQFLKDVINSIDIDYIKEWLVEDEVLTKADAQNYIKEFLED